MKFLIARNNGEFGGLYLYSIKPCRTRDGRFEPMPDDPFYCQLNRDAFPEVTFENSPQEVELKLVQEL